MYSDTEQTSLMLTEKKKKKGSNLRTIFAQKVLTEQFYALMGLCPHQSEPQEQELWGWRCSQELFFTTVRDFHRPSAVFHCSSQHYCQPVHYPLPWQFPVSISQRFVDIATLRCFLVWKETSSKMYWSRCSMPAVSTEEESLLGEIKLSNIPTPDLHSIKTMATKPVPFRINTAENINGKRAYEHLFFAFLIKGYISQSID